MNGLSRILYLADRYRIKVPGNVARALPYGDVILQVGEMGAAGAGVNLRLPDGQLKALVKQGAKGGEGSEEEFRLLAADVALQDLETRKEDLSLTEYFRLMQLIKDFSEGKNTLVELGELDLGDMTEYHEVIPKFESGFEPLDILTGGLYQGILVFMGKPGHGKTSLLLSIMESMRVSQAASSIWYYNIEIPKQMMAYKTKPLRDRTRFVKGKDLIFCGYRSMTEITQAVMADPDPDRVLIIDGPDAMTGASGEGRRYALEAVMIDLVKLKEVCKMILMSSQVRRSDHSIKLESGAESWAKAWYADIMVGVNKFGSGHRPKVRMNVTKNRFGISDREGVFEYDFATLEYNSNSMQEEEDW